jgi:hypothetical protein
MSTLQASAELDRQGFRPKWGGANWSKSSVGMILARSGHDLE